MPKVETTTDFTVVERTDIEFLNSLFDSEYILSRLVNNRPSNTLKMVMSLTNTTHAQTKADIVKYLKTRYRLQTDQPVNVGDYVLTYPSNQTTHSGTPCERIDISKKDSIALQIDKLMTI